MTAKDFKMLSEKYSNTGVIISKNYLISNDRLNSSARSISSHFKELGISNSTRIAVLLGNNTSFICTVLAVAYTGASCALISPSLRQWEIKKILQGAGIKWMVTDLKANGTVKAVSESAKIMYRKTDEILGEFILWDVFPENIQSVVSESNDFTLQLTSGVNGTSKIVPRSYENIMCEIATYTKAIHLSHEDSIICPAPFFHTYGFINGFLAGYLCGAKLILVEKFVPKEFIKLVEQYRPTIFIGVPFMYSMLNQTYLKDRVNLSSLRVCFSAGAKLSSEVAKTFFERYGLRINQQYGSSETGVMTMNLYDGTDDCDLVGKPVFGVDIRVVDEEGNDLPSSVEGEIKIKSPSATKGYINHNGAQKSAFKDGWYFTGDIGKFDNQGNLEITGRKSFFINVAGLKVDPFEVEQTIASFDQVKECAVVGIKTKNNSEIIRAYLVTGITLNSEIIVKYCKERLADFKVPREIVFVEELPKSPTGKVLKKYLI